MGTPITSPHGQPGFTVEGLGFGNPVPFPGVAYGLDADGTYMSSQGTLLCKRVYLFSDQDYADSSFPTEINLDLLTEPCVQNDEAWVEITVTTALTPFPFVGSGPYAGSQGGCPQLLANHSPFSQLAGQVSPYFFGQLAGWPEDPDLLQLTLWVNQLGTIQ